MGISQTSDDTDKTDYFNEYQQSSIVYQDGSYTAKLPWKRDHAELPSNYDVATKRTRNLIRRLQGEPPLLVKYDEIITEQERRGFIEKVDSNTPTTGQVHYIPHRPVKKGSTTTPIRIVYDCSSRKSPNLPSLNDCLESTAPPLNDLTSILMRFRIHSYAATTDIEKDFCTSVLMRKTEMLPVSCGLVTSTTRTVHYLPTVSSRCYLEPLAHRSF